MFYTGEMFPEEYRGELFVALHGSWNRSQRTGYKIVRVHMDSNGNALGTYEDFIVGWSPDPDARDVWGRPSAFAQLPDGSMLVLDDGGEFIYRVTYDGPASNVTPNDKLPTQWAHVRTLEVMSSFPNPANPEVWVPFVLGVDSQVRLEVYDMAGASVRSVDLGARATGAYTDRSKAAHWDGKNARGELVSSGVYFVQIRANSVWSRLQRVVITR